MKDEKDTVTMSCPVGPPGTLGSPGSVETSTISEVTYDDFLKLDIRVGVIKSAERIPKKDRLLKLEVDLGHLGMRTIVAGIAESYTPEQLVPRPPVDPSMNMLGTFPRAETKILVVTNLAPRKVGGIMSHGMLLAGKDAVEKIVLATCPFMPAGTQIG